MKKYVSLFILLCITTIICSISLAITAKNVKVNFVAGVGNASSSIKKTSCSHVYGPFVKLTSTDHGKKCSKCGVITARSTHVWKKLSDTSESCKTCGAIRTTASSESTAKPSEVLSISCASTSVNVGSKMGLAAKLDNNNVSATWSIIGGNGKATLSSTTGASIIITGIQEGTVVLSASYNGKSCSKTINIVAPSITLKPACNHYVPDIEKTNIVSNGFRGHTYDVWCKICKKYKSTGQSELHTYDGNDICTLCGYKKCPHSYKTYEMRNLITDDTYHTYDEWCEICNEFISYGYKCEHETKLAENGTRKCMICGYEYCEHPIDKIEKINVVRVVSIPSPRSPSYLIPGHMYDEWCNNCQKCISTGKSERHTFNDNYICTLCGYRNCRHSLNEIEVKNLIADDTYHTYDEWCRVCNEIIGHIQNDEHVEWRQTENGTKICKKCGYEKCLHRREGSEIEYQHIIRTSTDHTYDIWCKVCNKYQERQITAPHEYRDGSNMCVFCKYIRQ
jgi:hypothetical protein